MMCYNHINISFCKETYNKVSIANQCTNSVLIHTSLLLVPKNLKIDWCGLRPDIYSQYACEGVFRGQGHIPQSQYTHHWENIF